MAFANGYDMGFHFNLDYLGVTYLIIAGVWSLALLAGVIFLLRNRKLPQIRIRNLPLAISAVVTLHVYWILTLLAYILNGFFPCSTEYWIMSIYLPFGIALYHASNTQLLHIANIQKRYTDKTLPDDHNSVSLGEGEGPLKLLTIIKNYGATRKTMVAIMVGMTLQLICTLILFLISRNFHPGFGLIGHEVNMIDCRRGLEWLPSILWQFLWAWTYAPYLLWKVRHIEDVHGWRTQTICCCLAGLPATPMWLISLYLPAMAPVDKYFVPPLWFTPSILFMQAFAIFSPCLQIIKNRKLQNETRDIIAQWEDKQKMDGSITSGSTKVNSNTSKCSTNGSHCSRRGEMYTIRALEKTLLLNSQPLLVFAALRDFSGENISFLTHVDAWRAAWAPGPTMASVLRRAGTSAPTAEDVRRKQFVRAVEIYCSFVSLAYSDFPINLSSGHLKHLQAVFDDAAAAVNGMHADNVITPFQSYWERGPEIHSDTTLGKNRTIVLSTTASQISNVSTDAVSLSSDDFRESYITNFRTVDLSGKLPRSISVPGTFGPHVFDESVASIKQLVLTNTWPKFVNAGYASSIGKQTLKDRMLKQVERCGFPWLRSSDV